jgi:hypothetical protein
VGRRKRGGELIARRLPAGRRATITPWYGVDSSPERVSTPAAAARSQALAIPLAGLVDSTLAQGVEWDGPYWMPVEIGSLRGSARRRHGFRRRPTTNSASPRTSTSARARKRPSTSGTSRFIGAIGLSSSSRDGYPRARHRDKRDRPRRGVGMVRPLTREPGQHGPAPCQAKICSLRT